MAIAAQAVPITLTNSTGNRRRYTVADGTTISKGILLTCADPVTAAAATHAAVAAGISASDKEASDGSTSLDVWTDGIFDITASGAITVGDGIIFTNENKVEAARIALGQTNGFQVSEALLFGNGRIAGYALETATDGEVIACRIRT